MGARRLIGTGNAAASGRVLVVVAVLASFVAFLDGSVVNLALPAISANLGGGLALQQWVVDGYLLALGAVILLAGAVSDAYGRVTVLRAGLVLFGVASLGCAAAPTGWVLVAARCVQGIGAAFLVPSSLALLNEHFAGERRAAAIGTWTAWTGTAFVVGPPLGGLLVDTLDWRWVFGLNVIPIGLTLYLTARLPRDARGRAGSIDVVGALLGALGLTGTVFALIEQARFGWTHPVVLAALITGLMCLTAFPLWERRAEQPMMPLSLFAQRNFAVGNLVTLFFYAGMSLGPLIIGLFLQETVGMSATAAGVATLPIPVLSFLLARRFGTLAGRFGPRVFVAAGPLVAASGFLLLTTARDDFDVWTQMVPGLVVFGLGLSITVSPLTAAVLAAVDPAQSGIGSAVNNAVSRVAGLVAIAFLGVIVSGTTDLAGFQDGLLVVAALFAVAGVVAAVGVVDHVPDGRRIDAAAAAACHDRVAPPYGLESGRQQ